MSVSICRVPAGGTSRNTLALIEAAGTKPQANRPLETDLVKEDGEAATANG